MKYIENHKTMFKGVAFGRTTHTPLPSQNHSKGGGFQARNSVMLNKPKTSDYKSSTMVRELIYILFFLSKSDFEYK